MKARGWIYIWFLPLFWCFICMASYRYPGDEYGLWAISSMAGTWIVWVIRNVGDIKTLLPKVLIAGVVVMVVIGFIMDRLRVHHLLALGIFLVLAPALCILAIAQYPTYEAAMSKNGSLIAYVLGSMNLGLYGAIVLSVVATLIVKLFRRMARRRGAGPAEDSNPAM